MKTYKKIGYALVAVLITTTAVLAASSSSSSTATSSNGGTSIAISSSQSSGNGVAISNSNADASKGGNAVAESSSTAKNNEVIVSNSDAVSSSPNDNVRTTTVNGVTTSTKTSTSSSNTNSNTGNFFNYTPDRTKKVETENVNVVSSNNSPYFYTEKKVVNGTTIYIFNPANITNLQSSDVLVATNKPINITGENSETFNGSNLTYDMSLKDTNKSASLIEMLIKLFKP